MGFGRYREWQAGQEESCRTGQDVEVPRDRPASEHQNTHGDGGNAHGEGGGILTEKEKSRAQSQKPVGYASLKKLRTLPDD